MGRKLCCATRQRDYAGRDLGNILGTSVSAFTIVSSNWAVTPEGIQLAARVQNIFYVRLPIRYFFEAPTIAEQAA